MNKKNSGFTASGFTHPKNLNALANQYAEAVYSHLCQQNGGNWFQMLIGEQQITVAITDNAASIRLVVDSWLLEPIQQQYTQWESVATEVLTGCLDGDVLTAHGRTIWTEILSDMGDALAGAQGVFHA
ncbi:hypothetical protein ABLL29_004568 [Salmonella enterica subsp. enterica]